MAMDLPPSIGLPNGPRVDPPRGRLVNIAILGGTGKEGAGLAIRWALAGHSIIIGSRGAERARGQAAVAELGRSIGLRTIDAGPLSNAGPVEGITAVLATINRRYKIKNSGIKITGL